MNLHRSGSEPDWELVDPTERKFWQRVAARTKGIVTPGNFISSLGLFAVCHGLYQFSQGNKLIGAIEIGAGFACDAFDGVAAEATGTKSPLGKGVDASFDKVKIAGALYVLYASDIIPFVTIATVGAQNIANTAFTFAAMRKGRDMQPEEAGKKTMVAQCGGIALATLGHSIDQQTVSATLEVAGNATAVIGSFYPGLNATISYAKAAFTPLPTVELNTQLPELGFETEQ